MPINKCTSNGKPGFKWGNSNKCWTYTPNNVKSRQEAKKKCIQQAIKIEGPEKFAQIMKSEASEYSLTNIDMKNVLLDKESTKEQCDAILSLLNKSPLEFIFATNYLAEKT